MAALKSNEVIWAELFPQGNLTEGREEMEITGAGGGPAHPLSMRWNVK